jgi:hypothetical protein
LRPINTFDPRALPNLASRNSREVAVATLVLAAILPGLKEKTEAAVDLKNEDKFIFSPKASVGPTLEIPWAGVEDIEYGQKAGRRIVSAVFLTPFALFAKKRRHYVTISYKDAAEKEQAAVFEFDKNDIRQVLAIMKARTGKAITFQDDEAKKQMGMATK